MRSLIKVELKKMFSSKTTQFISLASLLLFVLLVVSFYSSMPNYKNHFQEFSDNNIKYFDETISNLKSEDKNGSNKIIKLKTYFTEKRKNLVSLSNSVSLNNEKDILLYEIRDLELDIAGYNANLLHGESIRDLEDTLSFKQYLFNNNIYVYSSIIDPSGSIMLLEFISQVLPYFLIFVTLILSGSAVSTEIAKGTLKLLLQQPYSRWVILLSKTLSCSISSMLIIFPFLVGWFALFSISFGAGYWNYPIAIKENIIGSFQINNSTYVPLFLYIFLAILISILAIMFFVSLGIFFSTAIHNATLSFFISLLPPLGYFVIKTVRFDAPYIINDTVSILNNSNFGAIVTVYIIATAFLVMCAIKRVIKFEIYT